MLAPSLRALIGGVGILCVGLGCESADGVGGDRSGARARGEMVSDAAAARDAAAVPDAAAATDADSGSDPYANVVAVSVSGEAGALDFSVSVESADVDCTQYTNWWEVLSADGELLYRRILEHAHTDENGTSDADALGNTFTRSGGPVPAETDQVVVVRAHISVGGYNGRVMRGSADSGFAIAPELEANFATEVETSAPQPSGCLF